MKKQKFEYVVCKPCWELKYCPYGCLVEDFPAPGDKIDIEEVKNNYNEILQNIRNGVYKTENDILSAYNCLSFNSPYMWTELEEYDYSDLRCNVFGHVCPVFFHAEEFSETLQNRRWTKSRHIPRNIMLKVIRRDGQVCQVCQKNVPDDKVQFDHIIPFSKGGPTTVENLRVLCSDCNLRKSDSLKELLR
ncbi:HNH endonuclease signature motif containing protein [Clostridium sp.]|uniref:HNH endonuclease n=1 Tax=Clostridium sp. TaxID=1506 RepID=UPI001A4FD320|nr:HNH endonuclease signature motif containing protein [Clostridium sp.]MBK5240236.1 HNH endonuclease [Clostridium sp.]